MPVGHMVCVKTTMLTKDLLSDCFVLGFRGQSSELCDKCYSYHQ